MKYRKDGMEQFNLPSGAEEIARDYCCYDMGAKHKCDKFEPVNCKFNGEPCNPNCRGGWYDKERGHCKGCKYGWRDPNIGWCFYREYQVKEK